LRRVVAQNRDSLPLLSALFIRILSANRSRARAERTTSNPVENSWRGGRKKFPVAEAMIGWMM